MRVELREKTFNAVVGVYVKRILEAHELTVKLRVSSDLSGSPEVALRLLSSELLDFAIAVAEATVIVKFTVPRQLADNVKEWVIIRHIRDSTDCSFTVARAVLGYYEEKR